MPVAMGSNAGLALSEVEGLSLYAVGANDLRCDPAEGAFIGRPVFTKDEG